MKPFVIPIWQKALFSYLSGIKDSYFCSKHHKILESKSSYLACPLEDKSVVWQFVLGDL